VELDAHINDSEFASAVAEEFLLLRGAHVDA